MNVVQLWETIGPFASLIALLIAFFNLRLIWRISTNHLPHIYEALRRIAAKAGVDISDLR